MNIINNIKRSRLKMAIFGCLILVSAGWRAMEIGMDGVASTCFAGVLTVITMFIGSDGYRKSD